MLSSAHYTHLINLILYTEDPPPNGLASVHINNWSTQLVQQLEYSIGPQYTYYITSENIYHHILFVATVICSPENRLELN